MGGKGAPVLRQMGKGAPSGPASKGRAPFGKGMFAKPVGGRQVQGLGGVRPQGFAMASRPGMGMVRNLALKPGSFGMRPVGAGNFAKGSGQAKGYGKEAKGKAKGKARR